MSSHLENLSKWREKWGGVPIVENGERTVSSDAKALEFAKKFCDPKLYYRRWQLFRVARNLGFYKGQHDISITQRLIESGTGYALERVKLPGNRRLVVDNCIPEGVDNEVSRLMKKQFEPNTHVRPTKLRPDLQAAAEMAGDALMYDLDMMNWPSIRGQFTFDTVIGGTGFLRGDWDETVTDLTAVARPDSAQCNAPGCETVVASTRITASDLGPRMLTGKDGMAIPVQGLDKLTNVDDLAPGESMAYNMNACPVCGVGELKPHTPLGASLSQDSDPFGRPLGTMIPRGTATISAPSPFEVWAVNGGIGVEPHTNKIWGRQSIEDLDWLASRYEDAIPHLEKGSMADMARLNPLMSARPGGGGDGFAITGSGVFDHHAVLTEVIVEPIPLPGLDKGRLIHVVCDRVVRNQDLMVDVTFEGESIPVPRVTYVASRYKRVPKEFYGRTPVDDAVPLNYQLDRAWTQLEDIREHGIPVMMKPEGAEIEWDDDTQGSMREATYRSVAPGFDPQRMILNGTPLTGNSYLPEIDRLRTRIREVLGPNAAESGENPVNTKTARQLEIQVEEAKQKRGPAEESIAGACEDMWTSHLERTWAFRQEPAMYEVDDDADTFKQESYTGTNLLRQTKVKVDVANAEDQSILQATKTQEAIQAGLLPEVQTDPVARDEALNILKVPRLSQQASVQVKRAEQGWAEWVRSIKPPKDGAPIGEPKYIVIDETLHDADIRFRVLGKRWESDEGYQIQQRTGWLTLLPRLCGWEDHLKKLEKMDAEQRAIYEGKDPNQYQAIYQQGSAMQANVVAANEAHKQAALKANQPPDPNVQDPPEFPQPPQDGLFLPADKQTRVLRALQDYAPSLSPTATVAPDKDLHSKMTSQVSSLLPMYATIQTYRLLAEIKKQAAAAGQQQVAEPGGVPGAAPGGMAA